MFVWPLARILGVFAVAPVFGNQAVPVAVKVCLGVGLTVLVTPLISVTGDINFASIAGMAVLAEQCLIGVAIGFTMRLVFAGVELAGETISMTMGLSFASFFDPMSQGRTAVVTQILTYLTTLVFLAANLHLQLIEALVQSFGSMPIGGSVSTNHMFGHLVTWAGNIFTSGLQISLPIVGALLITSAALALLTRAAPQLNIFGIGFPITLSVGILLIGAILPYLSGPLTAQLRGGLREVGTITSPAKQLPQIVKQRHS
jgi:flagellar biosynthetic protein FliR